MSLELAIKASYGWLIAAGSGAVYDPESEQIQMVAAVDDGAGAPAGLRVVERLDARHMLAASPRYDGFRDVVLDMARSGSRVRLLEVAGNREIVLTGVAPRDWRYTGTHGQMTHALPVPTDSSRKRVTFRAPTADLVALAREALDAGVTIDHIYDY
jgi:hypothetical protein